MTTETAVTPRVKKRQRVLKAAVGCAVGVALLSGGGGTFAAWQVQVETHGLAQKTIPTAAFKFDPPSPVTGWLDADGNPVTTPWLAPGETYTFHQASRALDIRGNLTGELSVDDAGLTVTMDNGDNTLLQYVTVKAGGVLKDKAGNLVADFSDAPFTVGPTHDGGRVYPTLTITVAPDAPPTFQDTAVKLGSSYVRLTQTI